MTEPEILALDFGRAADVDRHKGVQTLFRQRSPHRWIAVPLLRHRVDAQPEVVGACPDYPRVVGERLQIDEICTRLNAAVLVKLRGHTEPARGSRVR